jgi:hypothetical protein
MVTDSKIVNICRNFIIHDRGRIRFLIVLFCTVILFSLVLLILISKRHLLFFVGVKLVKVFVLKLKFNQGKCKSVNFLLQLL